MPDLQKQLREEIKRVEDEIDAKKSLIKKNIGNSLIVETAELEMKALHTRLSVPEANLAKQTASDH
jgi:hypothetical protein